MNSTDCEITERENNMKKVLKDKGKRASGSGSRWSLTDRNMSGGIPTLVVLILYS